jgi:hypothetical protein
VIALPDFLLVWKPDFSTVIVHVPAGIPMAEY